MFTLEYCFCKWKFPNYAFSMKGQGVDQTDCVVGIFTWDFRSAETCGFLVTGLSSYMNVKDGQQCFWSRHWTMAEMQILEW